MPLPSSLGRFNKGVVFRVLGPLGGRVRPFAIVGHTGRTTGSGYETVVWAFERDGTVAIALTYGPETDWVRNVLAAGGGTIGLGGEVTPIGDPRIVGDDAGLPFVPAPVRAALRALDVHEFLLADRLPPERRGS
jgi:deazaflavin-dependent oxidoreductase (nitroreductase family)